MDTILHWIGSIATVIGLLREVAGWLRDRRVRRDSR
jgi:hypothetical protein